MSAPFLTQSRSDSCVAACCAMLLHRRGAPPDEDIQATHDRLDGLCRHPEVHVLPDLKDGATLVGAWYESLDPIAEVSFEFLEGLVRQAWCAVIVHSGPWTHPILMHRKVSSPHGRLSNDRHSLLPRHAVVLTEWLDDGNIRVHDPWFGWNSQPIRIEARWLRSAWNGEIACFMP